jgi:hypothetical protein
MWKASSTGGGRWSSSARSLMLVIIAVLAGCAGGRPALTSSNGTFVPYFVDLRSVPVDESNLPKGPYTVSFRAFANTGFGGGWSDELSAKLSGEVSVAKAGTDPKFVDKSLSFTPVKGHPEAVDVAITVDLDGTGTWQIDLPTTCYDYAAMGFNGPEVLGLKGPVPPPPNAKRPNEYGCLASVVLTVGSCPHIAYCSPLQAEKSKGNHVWRVVWSEDAAGPAVKTPKVVAAAMNAAGESMGVDVTVVQEDSRHARVSIANLPGQSYGVTWNFGEDDAVAGKFLQELDCGLQPGYANVAETDADGAADLHSLPKVFTGVVASIVNAKALAPKSDAGGQ